jgi:heme-degrading monooxygenase HmoA
LPVAGDGTDPSFHQGQVVTVFRSRLRSTAEPAAGPTYDEVAAQMEAAARAMPGFVDFTQATTADGERVSLVTFDSWASHRAWRDDPRHRAAQRLGRAGFYAEYSTQVGETTACSQWSHRPD